MKLHIPTTAAPLPYTPPCLQTDDSGAPRAPADTDPVFTVKPVTEAEFDRLGYELFRHNIVPPSNEAFRAATIDECFEILGDDEGEEKANWLDGYWQSEDVFSTQMDEWHEQDRQRMIDETAGAPARPPAALPKRVMGLRDRNRALLFAEEMRKMSLKLRDMTIEMQSYEPRQRAGIARLVILGWRNLSTPFECPDGIVPEATYDALRAEIGKRALGELELFCVSLGRLSREDVGNSESQPETAPTDEPLPEPSAALDSSAGDSTSAGETTPSTSNSGATHETGSDETTDESSTSSSRSTGETEKSGYIPPDSLSERQPA